MNQVFSDEKIFTVDAKINRKKDWWFAYNPEDVPVIVRTKFPANYIYVLVQREWHAKSNFFKKGETVYKRSVFARSDGDIVKPLMETVASGRLYVFQQDSAPAHTS